MDNSAKVIWKHGLKGCLTEPGRAGDDFHRSLLAKPGLEVWAGIRSGLGCGREYPKQRK